MSDDLKLPKRINRMPHEQKRVTLTLWLSQDILEWLGTQRVQYQKAYAENIENAIQFALARCSNKPWARSFHVVPFQKKCTTIRIRPDYSLEIRRRAAVTGETLSVIVEGAMWLYIKSMGTARK